jgi:hypothetical protein
MARVALRALLTALAIAPHSVAVAVAAADPLPDSIDVVADRDDDDLDGIPDGEQLRVPRDARVDAIPLGEAFLGATIERRSGDSVRILAGGHPLPWGSVVPRGSLLQGVSPGSSVLVVRRGREVHEVTVRVWELGFRDGTGTAVDLARSHASLDRSPPSRVSGDVSTLYEEPDPLRLVVRTLGDAPPPLLLESVGPTGAHVDSLAAPPFAAVACDRDREPGLHCFSTEPLRFVVDETDRRHALASFRSLRAELGGAIVVREAGKKLQAIRVAGPRSTPAGPIGRLRAHLRPLVLRMAPGGVPAVGGNDAGAVALVRSELGEASRIWGECGVTFGPPEEMKVAVVDPPPPYLLSFGNELGLPASGGHVSVRVDGERTVTLTTTAGELPLEAAHAAASAFEAAGYRAEASPNARVAGGANPSVDVLVAKRSGAWATLERVKQEGRDLPLSDDPTLSVRIGKVSPGAGLAHFTDTDAASGTLEERTLLKAFDDGDPTTLEVVVVPFFTGGVRIGESFIGVDRGSLRNVVLFDRAGVRARRTSLTLAHELGHILLDVPGHPDDYGVDTPTRLMDADASDASPFGPRRLTLAECARVVRESGPAARTPLVREWPLTRLAYPPLRPNGQ